MWLIVDDRMADDRRIRRLPLAAVGLWIKLCAYHNFNLGDAEYDGWFDMFDVKSYGGTKRTFDQLLDAGLFEPFGNGWRPVYHEGVCKPPKLLTDEQRRARAEAGRKGGRAERKPSKREANGKQKQSIKPIPIPIYLSQPFPRPTASRLLAPASGLDPTPGPSPGPVSRPTPRSGPRGRPTRAMPAGWRAGPAPEPGSTPSPTASPHGRPGSNPPSAATRGPSTTDTSHAGKCHA